MYAIITLHTHNLFHLHLYSFYAEVLNYHPVTNLISCIAYLYHFSFSHGYEKKTV